MVICAGAALTFSLTRTGPRELEDSVTRLSDSQREEDAALDRQRRVTETIAILECRRRYSTAECPDVNERRPRIGRYGDRGECTRVVVVDGQRRNKSCGTR